MRQALELSTTTQPASAKRGAHSREIAAAGGEERDVEALDRLVGERAHLEVGVAVVDRRARPSARRRTGRPRAAGKPRSRMHAEHRRADRAGGAHDRDAQTARAARLPVTLGRWLARRVLGLDVLGAELERLVQRAHRVRRRGRRAITQEILIGEVEIISMLIAVVRRASSNTFAATPGWLRMPAPTIETLPISLVGDHARRDRARRRAARARARATAQVVLRDREGDLARCGRPTPARSGRSCRR